MWKFGNDTFWGKRIIGLTRKKLLVASKRTNNKLNPQMTPRPKSNPSHIDGRRVLSPLRHPSAPQFPVRSWRAFLKSSENFSGPKTVRGAFRVFFSGPEIVSQNTRKCSELSPGIFGNLFVLPGTIMRAGKLTGSLEHGFIITTFFLTENCNCNCKINLHVNAFLKNGF